MKTKAWPAIVKKATNLEIWGRNSVCHHPKTPENPVGQTHLVLIIDDIIDLVLISDNEADASRKLFQYFMEGQAEMKPVLQKERNGQ